MSAIGWSAYAVLTLLLLAALTVELYSFWLIFFATARQFNRVHAKIRARSVDWAEWRAR